MLIFFAGSFANCLLLILCNSRFIWCDSDIAVGTVFCGTFCGNDTHSRCGILIEKRFFKQFYSFLVQSKIFPFQTTYLSNSLKNQSKLQPIFHYQRNEPNNQTGKRKENGSEKGKGEIKKLLYS